MVKKSKLVGGEQLARDLTWDYQEQIQLAVRVGLELRASELQVQRSTLTSRPRCLLNSS